jgi:WD40 repeat protein
LPRSNTDKIEFGIETDTFPANGRGVAADNSEGPAQPWEISTGKALLRSDPKKSAFKECTGVACSPDNRFLASADGKGSIVVKEITSSREIARFRSTGGRRVKALAFAPDGRTLVSGGDEVMILLWHVADTAEMPKR